MKIFFKDNTAWDDTEALGMEDVGGNKRRTKRNTGKEKYKRNGGFTAKHVRVQEETIAKQRENMAQAAAKAGPARKRRTR